MYRKDHQNEVIYTTMNHPFYVKGQGFIEAGKLSKGDEIMNVSGGSYPVECVELEEKQETVYNFQVEDYHTYYVGKNSILVHNDCPEGSSKPSNKPYKNNKEANKQAQKQGYNDAHGLKEDYVGKSNVSKYDMKYDTKTGEIYLESKDGKTQIATGLIHEP